MLNPGVSENPSRTKLKVVPRTDTGAPRLETYDVSGVILGEGIRQTSPVTLEQRVPSLV